MSPRSRIAKRAAPTVAGNGSARGCARVRESGDQRPGPTPGLWRRNPCSFGSACGHRHRYRLRQVAGVSTADYRSKPTNRMNGRCICHPPSAPTTISQVRASPIRRLRTCPRWSTPGCAYDGDAPEEFADSPGAVRPAVAPPNPDMIHRSLLRNHACWPSSAGFMLHRVDECHYYWDIRPNVLRGAAPVAAVVANSICRPDERGRRSSSP